MGAKWADLHVDLQKELLKALVKLSPSLNAQDRSMCIYSLGSLGVVYSDCDIETQKVIGEISMRVFNLKISEHVGHFSFFAQQQSNVFIGLTLMGLKRSNMDATMIQAINHSLQYNLGFGNPQQLPNTIHS
jgi:acyl-[acyl carrier protein]--UDP-N-acetylglucosamine O-acyltransferase